MANTKVNYSYLERIVSSAQFRNMQDKTQLFYSAPKRQVRTRLTHTIEVKVIARDIGLKINNALSEDLIDLDLVDAIALAHDIGHTPFGHVGERTINDIVSGKDQLGGLLRDTDIHPMRFKHNVNTFRILRKLKVEDWRIVEGALCHTKVFYKGDDCAFRKNPYDPFREKTTKFEQFLQTNHAIATPPDTGKKLPSLTLEGQVVALADEVAQRVSDISDGLESRYFETVKNILSIQLTKNTREELERCIREKLIGDVVSTTLKRLKTAAAHFGKMDGIHHDLYREEVIAFSPDMKKRNDRLEDFITKMMAQSEAVRESDSRSRYIIRQLFKAYLNDVSLLPDRFIADYFNGVVNKSAFSAAQSVLSCADDDGEKAKVFQAVKQGKWRYTKEISGSKIVIDMKWVGKYFAVLLENEQGTRIPELCGLFDEYVLNIGFYIAGMTNTEAFTAYNRIYGH